MNKCIRNSTKEHPEEIYTLFSITSYISISFPQLIEYCTLLDTTPVSARFCSHMIDD